MEFGKAFGKLLFSPILAPYKIARDKIVKGALRGEETSVGRSLQDYFISTASSGPGLRLSEPKQQAVIEKLFPEWITEKHLESMVTPGGLSLDKFTTKVVGDGTVGHMELRARFLNPQGERIGHIEQAIGYGRDGLRYVRLGKVYLDPEWQGRGIGEELTRKQFNIYKHLGYDEVRLDASGTIGRYSWAPQGFDYESEETLIAHRKLIVKLLQEAGIPIDGSMKREILALRHSWEVAAFQVQTPQGAVRFSPTEKMIKEDGILDVPMHVGKYAMIAGPPWKGILSLDPDSSSWQQQMRFRARN